MRKKSKTVTTVKSTVPASDLSSQIAGLTSFDVDKALAEKSLYHFVKQAWHIIESVDYIDNWHIKVICEHLEALIRGDIKNLIINVPPGTSKSILSSVMLPAWTWTWRPTHRFLCACYSNELAIRDSVRSREIIESKWYKARWPATAIKEDLNQKIKFENTDGGWRIATTPRGRGLGEHPDSIVCFPYDEVVWTNRGPIKIGHIVEKRLKVSVPSLNEKTGRIEMKPVVGWRKNPGSELVRVKFSDGNSIRCTPGHLFCTKNRGRVRADSLTPVDTLTSQEVSYVFREFSPTFSVPDCFNRANRNAKAVGQNGRFVLAGGNLADLRDSQNGARPGLPAYTNGASHVGCNISPCASSQDSIYGVCSHSELLRKNTNRQIASGNFSRDLFCKYGTRSLLVKRKRPVPLGIVDVLGSGAVAKVRQNRVGAISVAMPDLLPFWAWANKSEHDNLMDAELDSLVALPGIESRVAIGGRSLEEPAFKELGTSRLSTVCGLKDRSRQALDSAKIGDHVVLKARDVSPILISHSGYSKKTYCLTVQDNHTFYVGGSQDRPTGMSVANCDDPHNTKELESESERNIVINWWDQTMGTRGIARGAGRCIVMQRLHELDLCGHVLRQGGYDHLMLPMNFEKDRCCKTSLGIGDPRTTEDELLWPELLPEDKLALVRLRLGPRGVAGQFQQRPAPKEGALFKEDDFQYFREEIVEVEGRVPVQDEPVKSRYPRPLPPIVAPGREKVKAFFLERVNKEGELESRRFLERDCATFMVVDTAATIKADSDWTVVGTLTITPEHDLLVRNIWRDKVETPFLYSAIDNQRRRGGNDILFVAVENRGSGIAVLQTAAADGRPMRGLEPGRWGKEVRASQASMLYSARKVWHLAGARWLVDLEGELLTFPNGQFDDCVDMVSYAAILATEDEILRIQTGGHHLHMWGAETQVAKKPAQAVEFAGGIRVLLDIDEEDAKPWWKR